MSRNINRVSVIAITRQHGFGLIEVMIAMTLGLLILAGISQYYVAGNRTDATTQALNQITDNARFIANKLGREVRMAGYIGPIQSVTVNNTTEDPNDPDDLTIANDFANAIAGFNNITSAGMTTELSSYLTSDPDPIENTDIVIFRTTQDVQPVSLTTNSTTDSLSIQKNISSSRACAGSVISGICTNDNLLISDLRNAVFFQASSITSNTSAAVITHAEDDRWVTFNNTAEVVPYQTVTYFLAEGENGRAALFRKENTNAAIELIPNVTNFQVTYGVDSNSDKSVDGSYITAGAVTNWNNVLSVRFALLLASENDGVVDTPMNVSAPALPDGTSTATDRRLYKSFIFTAALRNRIQ